MRKKGALQGHLTSLLPRAWTSYSHQLGLNVQGSLTLPGAVHEPTSNRHIPILIALPGGSFFWLTDFKFQSSISLVTVASLLPSQNLNMVGWGWGSLFSWVICVCVCVCVCFCVAFASLIIIVLHIKWH